MPASGPDAERARQQYRAWARSYDRALHNALMRRVRTDAIRALGVAAGATVLDVACGTGASFGELHERVGPSGRIIGVDLSPEMLGVAEQRVRRAGWENVTLVCAPVDEFVAPAAADAALFFLTHDVMRNPRALRRVVEQLRPGARVVAAGAKNPPRGALPLRLALRAGARRAITTTEGLDAPWSHLAALLPRLHVTSRALGLAYVASADVT